MKTTTGQLLPPHELQPTLRDDLTMAQRIAVWFEWMKFGDQLLLAGLQRDLKPGQTIEEAVRDWYKQQMEEHDKKLLHMMQEFDRRERRDGN